MNMKPLLKKTGANSTPTEAVEWDSTYPTHSTHSTHSTHLTYPTYLTYLTYLTYPTYLTPHLARTVQFIRAEGS
jgi:hypothetical protein